ncbi:hypothetical protein [Mycobacterium sp.]|uniref:hypothetical protein n=1 Tax=Mycobacterium sp. TaxID=1785 RepID=UPI003D13A019
MSDATTLFGLPGVQVERVERLADETRVVQVVTAEQTAAACPSCGVVSTSVNCERSSFTEAIAQVPPRARTTTRLRAQIGTAIGDPAAQWPRSRFHCTRKLRAITHTSF